MRDISQLDRPTLPHRLYRFLRTRGDQGATNKEVAQHLGKPENKKGLNAVARIVVELNKELRQYGQKVDAARPTHRLTELLQSEQPNAHDPSTGHTRVDCWFVGDDKKALEYEVNRMRHLKIFRDTHVRGAEGHPTYDRDTLSQFEDGLSSFLARDANNSAILVVGDLTERGYQVRLRRLARKFRRQVDWHQLPGSNIFMNFCLLEYGNGDKPEVLFGWGRYGRGSAEAVFRSSDEKLVGEFETFYELLVDRAASIRRERPETDKGLSCTEIWHDDFFKTLAPVERGKDSRSDLSIVTSFIINWDLFRNYVITCLERGVRIQIILMNPENDGLVRGRFAARDDGHTPQSAALDIKRQALDLSRLPRELPKCPGTIEVRISDLMPTGFMVHTATEALVGLMLARETYLRGPMIRADATTLLWKNLYDSDWLPRWERAARWSATAARSSARRARLTPRDRVISEAELIAIEGSVAGGEVWVATASGSNVGDEQAVFEDVMRRNAARGINYRYLAPKRGPGLTRLERLEEYFDGTPGDLFFHPVTDTAYFDAMLLSTTFISFAPRDPNATVFMQLPLSGREKGWLRLDTSTAERVMKAMRRLKRDYRARPVRSIRRP